MFGLSRTPASRAVAAGALALVAVTLAVGTEVAGRTQPAHAQPVVGPDVKVNNVGYVPGLPKKASVVNGSTSPLPWVLLNGSGQQVASGQTTVFGFDQASGDHVHTIDFSDVDEPGSGYTLTVAGATSYPFEISAEPFQELRYDALAFFYHQRSGIPIEAQFVGSQYARPAGHVNVPPNTGDDNVPCRSSSPCGYTLDVRGGWYDAGDHGKYVVNGGISTWQLLNAYERTLHVDGADAGALGDGTLAIPEGGNGVPDILDEARWSVELLLSMQVPAGQPQAGMAHHKIHDQNWTGIPMLPHQDPQPRFLAPPSTAATLNLAAVAAQCTRLWSDTDPGFAAECLDAAETAYAAAKANPNVIAPASDGQGGGAYADSNVSDEFYWAAAELFAATGAGQYEADLRAHPLFFGNSFGTRGADWGNTGLLGDITLAVVPNDLSSGEVASLRGSFTPAANTLLDLINNQGYPAPYRQTEGGNLVYDWGSNNLLLNNAVVLALAHDFTGGTQYRDGVFATLDYMLGRNPLSQSYVTGYGEQAARNVHHRFWANQADSSLPIAPPGVLAGGPNSRLQDPIAQQQLAGCAPQECYIDHIDSFSTNEVTINWNSVLAWVSVWAGEQVPDDDPPPDDTQPPSQPGTPSASNVTPSSASLSWSPSNDNVGVVGYDVWRSLSGQADELLGSTPASSIELTGLAPDTTYTVYVVARDAAGNQSPQSGTATFTTPPEDPGGGGDAVCQVDYSLAWDNSQGGFGANITITNLADPIDGWVLEFAFPSGQVVDHGWSAQWSQQGSQVTATNLSWNGQLGTNQSAQIGFNGSYGNANAAPVAFSVNGSTCST
jgi:endoglucanase